MRTISAAEPARVTLADGKERKFLLLRGEMRRLKERLGVPSDSELLHLPAEKMLIPLLCAAQFDVEGERLTEDQIEDLSPVDIMWSGKTIAAIFGASLPDPRPTEAGTTASVSAPPPPNSGNGPSS